MTTTRTAATTNAARRGVTLITGAQGEFGHALIRALSESPTARIVALDLRPLDKDLAPLCERAVAGDLLDAAALDRAIGDDHIDAVYHLAALLSRSAERNPDLAHRVNVDGTVRLLNLASNRSAASETPVRFIFPSSIAVYGFASASDKARAGAVREDDHNAPQTLYGCHKLACEHIGRYHAVRWGAHLGAPPRSRVDFRCIRFPGVISADTVPTGGTSDFGPEMLHAAAAGTRYSCFVRPDTRIPFMTMPDAVGALVRLANADAARLTRRVYNVGAFNPSAEEFAARVRAAFPGAQIEYAPDAARQSIVDSWPENVNDAAARADWGYAPRHDFERAFTDYFLPRIG